MNFVSFWVCIKMRVQLIIEILERKIVNIFLHISFNIYCGYYSKNRLIDYPKHLFSLLISFLFNNALLHI